MDKACGRWALLALLVAIVPAVPPAHASCIIQDGLDLQTGIRGDQVEQVLAGNYLRHSSHYYRWFQRAAKRSEKEWRLLYDGSRFVGSLRPSWPTFQGR